MSGFVRHYVMREAAINDLPTGTFEVTKHQRLVLFRVKSIRVCKSVRRHAYLMTAKSPTNTTTQGELKSCQGLHHNRVNVLLMKAWFGKYPIVIRLFCISFERITRRATLQAGVIERLIEETGRGVVINHLNAIAAWSRRYLLGGQINFCSQNLTVDSDTRILG